MCEIAFETDTAADPGECCYQEFSVTYGEDPDRGFAIDQAMLTYQQNAEPGVGGP